MFREFRSYPDEPVIILDGLIKAAKGGDWDFVNQGIPKICNEPQFVEWAASYAINHEDLNLRLFGVNFIEKSECNLNQEQIKSLKSLMKKDNYSHVRHGAGFALFKHNVCSRDVIQAIKGAAKNSETREKAQGFLGEFRNRPRKFFIFGRDAGN